MKTDCQIDFDEQLPLWHQCLNDIVHEGSLVAWPGAGDDGASISYGIVLELRRKSMLVSVHGSSRHAVARTHVIQNRQFGKVLVFREPW